MFAKLKTWWRGESAAEITKEWTAKDAFRASKDGELESALDMIRAHVQHGCLTQEMRLYHQSTVVELRRLGFAVECLSRDAKLRERYNTVYAFRVSWDMRSTMDDAALASGVPPTAVHPHPVKAGKTDEVH